MFDKKHTKKEIEEVILRVAIEITKKGEGALFVIGEKVEYSKLMKQKLKSFSVFDNGAEKVLKGLAVVDGAVIISKEGKVVDYGVLIKNAKPFIGFGTRHAAAVAASGSGNTVILCSEEEKKIKIFRNGRYIMQVDALEKGIEKKTPQIATMLETIGAGFLGTFGAAALVPTLGLALIPGVIIFGGSYLAIKKMLEHFNFK
jgi:DNA integrity scanning protein DisA with diadenylate cyclase activity